MRPSKPFSGDGKGPGNPILKHGIYRVMDNEINDNEIMRIPGTSPRSYIGFPKYEQVHFGLASPMKRMRRFDVHGSENDPGEGSPCFRLIHKYCARKIMGSLAHAARAGSQAGPAFPINCSKSISWDALVSAFSVVRIWLRAFVWRRWDSAAQQSAGTKISRFRKYPSLAVNRTHESVVSPQRISFSACKSCSRRSRGV